MAELTTWLSLVHTRGLGPKLLRKLLAGFGSVDAIASASDSKLASIGLSRKVIDAMKNVDQKFIDTDINWSQEGDDRYILTLESDHYPSLLKEIADPPIVLYVRGDPEVLQTPQLAVVGSRKPGPGAQTNAQRLAGEIASFGITITSGLALGVDAIAHRAALDANGFTIAVTATGLDRVYPASHQSLAQEIAASGAIISEFPIGTNPLPAYFPRRNRVISGLSYGTLVVEAALKSGTLTTAAHATEQSREVFAIPGNIDNPQARGSHALLKDGATLVETSADILRQLAPVIPKSIDFATDPGTASAQNKPTPPSPSPAPAPSPAPVLEPKIVAPATDSPHRTRTENRLNRSGDEQQSAVLAAIEYEPLSLDDLVDTTGLDIVAVTNLALELELTGLIETVAGGRYQKIPAGKFSK